MLKILFHILNKLIDLVVVLLKTYKARDGLECYVLGFYVNMERVDLLMKRALVGRVEFVKVSIVELIDWANK